MKALHPIAAAVLAALVAGCGAEDAPNPFAHAPLAAVEVRPDTPGNNLLHRFEPGDVVETFASLGGQFLIHYTKMGPNAVPAADADGGGTPDFVEEVAGVYDEVLAHYQTLGFRVPVSDGDIADNGGDDKFDVYLVDFAGMADGSFTKDVCDKEICAGFMVQENDYKGYGYPSTLIANRILGSHEFFHAIQAAYDAGQSTIVSEGTAVWGTESFDPSLADLEGFLPGYMENCDHSLDIPLPGPVDPFSYGSAIFFQFLAEKYDPATIRALWERLEDGANKIEDPMWFQELEPMLQDQAKTSFASAFVDFATWNLFTGKHADPGRGYAAGSGYPSVKMEDVAAPYSDELRVFYASTQYFAVPPDGRTTMTAALVPPAAHPDAADDLTLLLTADRASKYDPVVKVVDPTSGSEAIDVSGTDRFLAVVVNGRQDGDSRKPTLCIGSPDEVKACKEIAGAGTGGAGGGGGSTSGPHEDPGPKESDGGGCGCRTTGPTRDALWWPALVALVVLRRRFCQAALGAAIGPARRPAGAIARHPGGTCLFTGRSARADRVTMGAPPPNPVYVGGSAPKPPFTLGAPPPNPRYAHAS